MEDERAETDPSTIIASTSTAAPAAEAETIKSEETPLGCEHYKRKCKLICPQCNKAYTCRFCHDENEEHPLDRHAVKEVECLVCGTRQPSAESCTKCSTLFGKYVCLKCNLFNDELRDQFHCDPCGICRVGPKSNFFHCPKCDMCLPKTKEDHKCIEKVSRAPCSICFEDLHTSRISAHIPPCGHLIHDTCFHQMLENGLFSCPICNTSMIEMKDIWKYYDEQIEKNPITCEEFTKDVYILCRDCHEHSEVRFHFIGLKCSHCASYNTVMDDKPPQAKPKPQAPSGEPEAEATSSSISSNNVENTEESGSNE